MGNFSPPNEMDFREYSKEDDRINALPEPKKHQIIEQSWQQIFGGKDNDQWIQGCIWEINYHDVVKVDHHHDNHRLKVFTPKRKIFDN